MLHATRYHQNGCSESMTDSEYRRQLIAIGDAAAAEIEQYVRQLKAGGE
jgi:hypothetical protein